MSTVDLPAVRAHLARPGTVTIEALPAPYFDRGHLPGAVRALAAELDERAEALIPTKDTPVVVYCSGPTCPNSHQAFGALRRLGYTNVKVFVGGKAAWTEAGLALEAGSIAA